MEDVLEEQPKLKDEVVVRKAIVFAVPQEFAIPRAGSTNTPAEMYIGENRMYIAGFQNGNVLRGIELEKETLIPQFARKLSTNVNSQNWEEKVNDFWVNYSVRIPIAQVVELPGKKLPKIDGGRMLDAGYRVKDGLIYPNVIDDYILYELMIKDQGEFDVAKSPKEYANVYAYKFFCVSAEDEEARKTEVRKNRMTVFAEITKLTTDTDNLDKLRFIVSLTSKEISSIQATDITREEALDDIMLLAEEDPDKLLKVINDKHLAERALVRQLRDANILQQSGDTYFFNDEPLGTLGETIMFIKKPESDSLVAQFKRRLSAYQELTLGKRA